MKDFLKKITGITAREERQKELEQSMAELEAIRNEALRTAQELEKQLAELVETQQKVASVKREEEIVKMSAKEKATAAGEPWVGVLDTKVNPDNIRNGFFELDWNSFFVDQLRRNGFGADGDEEEQIVDRWFRTLCHDVAAESEVDMTHRNVGYININRRNDGLTEVS